MKYEIAILGAGPGGYVAAIRAAQLGAKVAVIERDALGGTCLNHGCIPTKALLAGASVVETIKRAELFGIKIQGYQVDYKRMVSRKDMVVKQLQQGISYLFKKNKVDLFIGKGYITGPNRIEVTGLSGVQEIEANNIIIATGSEPAMFPGI